MVSPALVGSAQVQPRVDSNPAGTAEASKYTATATGTVKRLSVYLDAASTATSVHLGLYTNAADGKPRKLLTSGRITNPVAGTWNTVSVPATAVKAAADYWLAVLSRERERVHGIACGGRGFASGTCPRRWSGPSIGGVRMASHFLGNGIQSNTACDRHLCLVRAG